MKKIFNEAALADTAIFKGMSPDETAAALKGLSAEEKSYEKGDILICAGSKTDRMGLVLEGSVTIENNDLWGNRTILSIVGRNQFFAETYAFLKDESLLVDAVANENCRVLYLKVGDLRGRISGKESWTIKLVTNLLSISAHKNLMLSGRSFHTSPKTVRGRVMSYLNSIYLKTGNKSFDIPFDRQQLADYLNLDRTALSKELGKMKKDGLIAFEKNHFVLDGEEKFL